MRFLGKILDAVDSFLAQGVHAGLEGFEALAVVGKNLTFLKILVLIGLRDLFRGFLIGFVQLFHDQLEGCGDAVFV